MALTFAEYWEKRSGVVAEMAQSREPVKAGIPLDDEDDDFIAQVVAAGLKAGINPPVSKEAALRSRYTTLLQDKVPDGGNVRVFVASKKKFAALPIARTHLAHLQQKLRAAGLVHAAEHGFQPHNPDVQPEDKKFYDDAFGRQNAADVLKKRIIDVNYKMKTGSIIDLAPKGSVPVPGEDTKRITKPVPNTWSTDYARSFFADKSRESEHKSLSTLDELPGSTSKQKMYDFSDIWRHVHSLVGDLKEDGKYILPQVWELFEKALPQAGNTIFAGVRSKLLEFDPSSLENELQLKLAMLQATAAILSDPLRGNKRSKGGDFLTEVAELFASGAELASRAKSYANDYVRSGMGINTNNTRRREYGGTNGTAPVQADEMGREDDLDRDIDDQEALDKAEPPPVANRPKAGPNSPAALKIKAQMQAIEPQVQKVIAKLDAAHWNMSAVTDEEWELYAKYERMEKELERAINAPADDFEDSKLPVAANRHLPRRNEVAGAGGTLGPLDRNNPDFQVEGDPCSQVILGFNAWCKKRERKKGWDGIK